MLNFKQLGIAIAVALIFFSSVLFLSANTSILQTKPSEKKPQENTFLQEQPTVLPTQIIPAVPTPTQIPRTIPESELNEAINSFRVSHGRSQLQIHPGLCQEARDRVVEILTQAKVNGELVLNHEGFEADVKSGKLTKLTGKQEFGENIASAHCLRPSDQVAVEVTTGIQLVEWCFDSSAGHRDNLLRPEWSDMCSSGEFPLYVQLFAR